ncbi:MAG: strawberry notch-like NTP hydrolase domain-containing protein [Rickettsiales bacterium]
MAELSQPETWQQVCTSPLVTKTAVSTGYLPEHDPGRGSVPYVPRYSFDGVKDHPSKVEIDFFLACAEMPDLSGISLSLPQEAWDNLSSLQLEFLLLATYAMRRGATANGILSAILNADGTGVGKTRQILALIMLFLLVGYGNNGNAPSSSNASCRGLFLTANADLAKALKSEWKVLGGQENCIISSVSDSPSPAILCTSYTVFAKDDNNNDIVRWWLKGASEVMIVADEAHKILSQSKKTQRFNNFQSLVKDFPNAFIPNFSATPADTIEGLASSWRSFLSIPGVAQQNVPPGLSVSLISGALQFAKESAHPEIMSAKNTLHKAAIVQMANEGIYVLRRLEMSGIRWSRQSISMETIHPTLNMTYRAIYDDYAFYLMNLFIGLNDTKNMLTLAQKVMNEVASHFHALSAIEYAKDRL